MKTGPGPFGAAIAGWSGTRSAATARPPTTASHPRRPEMRRCRRAFMSGDPIGWRPEVRAHRVHARQWRILGRADALHERASELLVELRAHAFLDADQALVDRECLAIGPRRRHGRECVCDRQETRDQRDLLAFEPAEIAPPVPSFVVEPGPGLNELEMGCLLYTSDAADE